MADFDAARSTGRRAGHGRRRGRLAAAAAAAALLLGSGLARAEGSCPRPDSPAHARQLAAEAFQQGERLYSAHDCSAAGSFQCSFDLFPHPSTLFNVGRTAEDCGQLEAAVSAYRTYLEAYPDESDRAEVDSRLRSVEASLREAAAPPSPPPPPTTEGEDPPPPPPTTPPTPIDPTWVSGWVTAGLGAALVITGGVLTAMAGVRHDEFLEAQDDGAPPNEIDALRDEGRSFEIGGPVVISIGAAALVTSVVLLWLSWPHPADTAGRGGRALVSPVLGHELGGLSLSGSF